MRLHDENYQVEKTESLGRDDDISYSFAKVYSLKVLIIQSIAGMTIGYDGFFRPSSVWKTPNLLEARGCTLRIFGFEFSLTEMEWWDIRPATTKTSDITTAFGAPL